MFVPHCREEENSIHLQIMNSLAGMTEIRAELKCCGDYIGHQGGAGRLMWCVCTAVLAVKVRLLLVVLENRSVQTHGS